MSTVRIVRIADNSPTAAGKLLDALADIDGVTIETAPPDELAACSVCGTDVLKSHLVAHAHIVGRICPLCADAAKGIEQRMHEAHSKAWREFASQLPQMIRDARNGAPEPVFYRGLE